MIGVSLAEVQVSLEVEQLIGIAVFDGRKIRHVQRTFGPSQDIVAERFVFSTQKKYIVIRITVVGQVPILSLYIWLGHGRDHRIIDINIEHIAFGLGEITVPNHVVAVVIKERFGWGERVVMRNDIDPWT